MMYRARYFQFLSYLSVAYLAATVLFSLGMRVHLHIYEHAHVMADHEHPEYVHLASVADDVDPDLLGNIDYSTAGLVKKISFDATSVACLITIILFTLSLCLRFWRHRDDRAPLLPRSDSRPPPSRAPPIS